MSELRVCPREYATLMIITARIPTIKRNGQQNPKFAAPHISSHPHQMQLASTSWLLSQALQLESEGRK
jgi:hypothetical protein